MQFPLYVVRALKNGSLNRCIIYRLCLRDTDDREIHLIEHFHNTETLCNDGQQNKINRETMRYFVVFQEYFNNFFSDKVLI